MKTKLLLAAAAAAAALVMGAPALAETINVSGYVNQYCALTPGTTNINFGNLGAQGTGISPINVNYSLYCNVGFDTTVSSLNGRLLNGNAPIGNVGPEGGATANRYLPDGTGTFYAALDYKLTSGAVTLDSSSFNAGTIVPLTSNAPTNLAVPVSFSPVALSGSHQLTAGSYNDTLTITITPTGL
jgi:hypothetical protein